MNIGLGIGVTNRSPKPSAGATNLGFDPADTNAQITLSNDNKTATCSASLSNFNAQSVTSHTSSTLRYFELVVDNIGVADYRPGIADDAMGTIMGTGNSVAITPAGAVTENSVTVKTLGTYTTGAILQFWLKPSTGDYWIGIDNTVDGTPSTETSPTGTLTVATFKIGLSPRRLNNAGTIRTIASEFSYSAQGATAWDE